MRSKYKKEYKIKGGLVIIPNPLSNRSFTHSLLNSLLLNWLSLKACCTTTSQSPFHSSLALTIKIYIHFFDSFEMQSITSSDSHSIISLVIPRDHGISNPAVIAHSSALTEIPTPVFIPNPTIQDPLLSRMSPSAPEHPEFPLLSSTLSFIHSLGGYFQPIQLTSYGYKLRHLPPLVRFMSATRLLITFKGQV